jgi:2-hydroxychromene-2-carboxylate isomerase
VIATYDPKVNHKPVILVDLFSETGGLPIKRHPVRQRYRMVELQRRRVRLTGLYARRRGILGTGPDRTARGRIEVGPRAL